MTRALPLFAGFLLGLVAAVAGCGTPRQRYKVLSFFFDGVPDPDAPAQEASPEAAQAGPGTVVQTRGSKHQRRCESCHKSTQKREGRSSMVALSMDGFRAAWKECRSCHSDAKEVGPQALVLRKGAWLHGPVARGECRDCHRPHTSDFLHLMRGERSEEACLGCHVELAARSGSMAGIDCATCHDPHAAPDPSSLFVRGGAGEICAQCHPLLRKERPWLHGPVAVGGCNLCHDAHGSEGSVRHVRRPIAPICAGCHENETLSAVHQADLTRECDSCHEPHAATRASDQFLKERIAQSLKGSRTFGVPPPDSSRGRGAERAGPPDQRPRTSSP